MLNLIDEIIQKNQLETIEDLLNLIPKHMCHITQESDVFKTYEPSTIRFAFSEDEAKVHEETYRKYAEEIIPSLTLEDYLKVFLDDSPRLPCFCSGIGDVFGSIYARMSNQLVYVVRRVYVNYLYQPARRHCLNAIIENGRVRYIDAAVYNLVLDKKNKKMIHPDGLVGFRADDIEEKFLRSDGWLQTEPFQREMFFQDNELKDNFYPNPIEGGLKDEFQRTFDWRAQEASHAA